MERISAPCVSSGIARPNTAPVSHRRHYTPGWICLDCQPKTQSSDSRVSSPLLQTPRLRRLLLPPFFPSALSLPSSSAPGDGDGVPSSYATQRLAPSDTSPDINRNSPPSSPSGSSKPRLPLFPLYPVWRCKNLSQICLAVGAVRSLFITFSLLPVQTGRRCKGRRTLHHV